MEKLDFELCRNEVVTEVGQFSLVGIVRLKHPIRRIADDGVEAAAVHDGLEFVGPVEGVEFEAGFVVERGEIRLGVKIGADEAIAALDVVAEVGEDAVEIELPAAEFAGFAFEDFEEQRKLGDLDGLGVDIHAVEVGDEDAFALGGGELPVAGGGAGGRRGGRKRLGDKPLHLGGK